jgi:hypothetical protein
MPLQCLFLLLSLLLFRSRVPQFPVNVPQSLIPAMKAWFIPFSISP